MGRPGAQSGAIRFQNEDVGALRDSLEQLLNVVSKPEAQNQIQSPFTPGEVLHQKAGFIHRIIAAVQKKLASIRASEDGRRSALYFRFNEGYGRRCLVGHGSSLT